MHKVNLASACWYPCTQVMKAVSEVVDDPSKLDNWRHKPQLYAMLQRLLGR